MRQAIKLFKDELFEDAFKNRTKKNLTRICEKLGIYGMDDEGIKERAKEILSERVVVKELEEESDSSSSEEECGSWSYIADDQCVFTPMMKINIIKPSNIISDAPVSMDTEIKDEADEVDEAPTVNQEIKQGEIRECVAPHQKSEETVSSICGDIRRVKKDEDFVIFADIKWRCVNKRVNYFIEKMKMYMKLEREACETYALMREEEDYEERKYYEGEYEDIEKMRTNLLSNLKKEFVYHEQL